MPAPGMGPVVSRPRTPILLASIEAEVTTSPAIADIAAALATSRSTISRIVQREAGVHWDAFVAGVLHPRSTPDVDDVPMPTVRRPVPGSIERGQPVSLPVGVPTATCSSCGCTRPVAEMTSLVVGGRVTAHVCIPVAGWRCVPVALAAAEPTPDRIQRDRLVPRAL